MRLADFILANIEPILAEWEAFARSIWPSSSVSATDPVTLRDDAEDVLRATATDMKSNQTSAQQADKSQGKSRGGGDGAPESARMDRASLAHGRDRHGSGFDLPEVISEYRALRASVVRLWRESHPNPDAHDLEDLTRFSESIDQSLTESVLAYTKIVEQERQWATNEQTRLALQLREMNEALLKSSVRQQELAERAGLLAAIVTSSEDAIISKNLDGVMTSWNLGAERLFGYTPEEAVGKPVTMLIPPDHIDEEAEILARIRRGQVLEHYETVRRRKDGTLIDISLTVSPLRDASGTIIGASKIARDITQTMAMHKQLTEQAEAIAGESRRKDEFLAMLSHELRNPLAPIRSAVHLMRTRERGSEDAIQQQAREIIERQVANLTKIVSDLLEVSRVISGRIRLNLQIVDVNQILTHAVETAKSLIEERKHELALNLSPDPVWCHADATRLEEVFINLLNNAAKYTPDGGRIEVWCELVNSPLPLGEGLGVRAEYPAGAPSPRPSPGGRGSQQYAQFRVRDNGMGIDHNLLPHIFDLFTQADRSLARSAGGLGIGLSLAHRLVDLHGGSIEAKSPPEGPHPRPRAGGEGANRPGSEFIVRLALAATPPEATQSETPTVETASSAAGMRVLVVDDNIDLVMMLASSLRQRGYSVQSAYTGPEGLKIAEQWRPDVIILDIGLPGLDGYEVARRLRTDESTRDVRIIALTGYGRDADVALAREAGFDAHLVKPYEFDELEKLMVPV